MKRARVCECDDEEYCKGNVLSPTAFNCNSNLDKRKSNDKFRPSLAPQNDMYPTHEINASSFDAIVLQWSELNLRKINGRLFYSVANPPVGVRGLNAFGFKTWVSRIVVTHIGLVLSEVQHITNTPLDNTNGIIACSSGATRHESCPPCLRIHYL